MVSGSKNKKELVFAKDKKQGVLAVFAIFLIIGSAINLKNSMPERDTNGTSSLQEVSSTQNPGLNQNQQTDQQSLAQDAQDIFSQAINFQDKNSQNQNSSMNNNDGSDIEIITTPRNKGKMVAITVLDTGRADPFLPLGEAPFSTLHKNNKTAVSLPYLTPPPEILSVNSDAQNVMNTTISGILYDKHNPSAIINIEGTDYLVKKGDIINRYKILSIGQNQVLVQLGKNIYTAGVGELLSLTDLRSITANLDKKFGGNDITINTKKKG